MRKLLCCALLLCVLCGVAIAEEGEFRVATEVSYAPFNWRQAGPENGAYPMEGAKDFGNGYDIWIAQKLAEGLGKKLVLVDVVWEEIFSVLLSGEVDAVISGVSFTQARQQIMDFSDPYYQSGPVVVVLKDGPYSRAKTLMDFPAAKIVAQVDTFHLDLIDQLVDSFEQMALVDLASMIQALGNGEVDGFITDAPAAMVAITRHPEFAIVAFSPEEGFVLDSAETNICVVLQQAQSDLRDQINQLLGAITQEERDSLMTEAVRLQEKP